MTRRSIVNSEGHFIELLVLEKDGTLLGYRLPDGCTAVQYLNEARTETNGHIHPPLKPRWDFSLNAWVDDATEEELNIAFPVDDFKTPTDTERIEALEAAVMEIAEVLANG